MKQKEQQLLLKDLCGRLPYGVKCIVEGLDDCTLMPSDIEEEREIKPYLELDNMLKLTPPATIISIPRTPRTAKAYDEWKSDTATITVRAYKWQDSYYIDWTRRCAEDRIAKVEKLFNSL